MSEAPKYTPLPVQEIISWVPGKLFSLRVPRPADFDFTAGQFARLGLPGPQAQDGAPDLWRAYSMVSGPRAPYLEFYSVVVPDGAFSPRLAQLAPGDTLYLDRTPYGFLTTEKLTPGGDLWLLGTGTGLGPYLSLLEDPRTWEAFGRIVVVHGVRHAEELAYRDVLEGWRQRPDWAGYAAQDPNKLVYLPIATRETVPGMPQARLTTLLADGRLQALAGVALDPAHSNVMLCGNPQMLIEARQWLSQQGFKPGRRGALGNLAVENYW